MTAPLDPVPPTETPPLSRDRSRKVTGGFAVMLLVLLAYRAYSPHLSARPTEPLAPVGRVDLNTADRTELMQIAGVGPGRADAILAHRAANGAFGRLEELDQVNGFGPRTLQKARPQITAGAESSLETLERKHQFPSASIPSPGGKIRTGEPPINVNTASVTELQRLPGVGPVMAQKIMDYRQVKRFESVDELRKVNRLGPKTLDSLRPFVVVN